MIYAILIVIVLFFAFLLIRKGKGISGKGTTSFVMRQGKMYKVDEAFEASTSADLPRMLKAVSTDTNPIDRHFLLMAIVIETYKNRSDQGMRKICKEIGEKHLAEFNGLVPSLKREFDNVLPRVPTFQHLATVYTEEGDFERAIEICKLAIKYDLHDNTRGGFEERIERINKKWKKSQVMK